MLNLDIGKELSGGHIVHGRVGDNKSYTEKISVINEDGSPFDLTGLTITFMGNTHNFQTKVIDSDGAALNDAEKGLFQYTFPSEAFGVAGPYERAYFQFTNKNGVVATTGDFEVIVLDNADLNASEAETVISEFNKLIEELQKLQEENIADLKQQQDDYVVELSQAFAGIQTDLITLEGKINSYEASINETATEVQGTISGAVAEALDTVSQALDDFQNGNFWTKEESFNKEESSANVIYQVIGKEKAEITFRLDAKSEFVKVSSVGYTTLLSPTNVSWTPLTEEQLNNLSSLDGSLYSARDVAANYMQQLKYDCDILGFFKSLLGEKFFTIRGATTDSQKVEVLESLITDFTSNVYGYGSGGGINKLTHRNWNGTWTVSDSTAANEVTRIGQTIESTDTNWKKLINGGKISVLSNSEPTISPNYSTVNIDYLCLDVTIELSANEHFEYMIAANHRENLATQEEAEAGTDTTKTMTPATTAQSIDNRAVTLASNQTIGGIKNFKDGLMINDVSLSTITRKVIYEADGVGGYFNAADKFTLGASGKIDKIVLLWSRVDDTAGTLLNYSWSQTVLSPDDLVVGNSYRIQMTTDNYKFVTFANESGNVTISGANENSVAPNRIYRIKRIIAYLKN